MQWRDRIVTITVLVSVSFLSFTVLFLAILVVTPYQTWLRDLRILGLCFNVFGALVAVIPRALRDRKDIEALAGTYWNENPHFKRFLFKGHFHRAERHGPIQYRIRFTTAGQSWLVSLPPYACNRVAATHPSKNKIAPGVTSLTISVICGG